MPQRKHITHNCYYYCLHDANRTKNKNISNGYSKTWRHFIIDKANFADFQVIQILVNNSKKQKLEIPKTFFMLVVRLRKFYHHTHIISLSHFPPQTLTFSFFSFFLHNYDKSVTQTCLFADWMYSSSIDGSLLVSSRAGKIFDLNTKHSQFSYKKPLLLSLWRCKNLR